MIIVSEKKVLTVSSSEKGTEFFKRFLGENFTNEFVFSGAEARRRLADRDYDIVIINCPLKDEYGTELAEEIVKDTYTGVLTLVKSDVFDSVSYHMEKIGVYCLPKPLSIQLFSQGINMCVATNVRLKGFAKKTETLKEKMEEIKLESRAKLLLITKLAFNEEEAHRYIEKQAMDRCVKKKSVALEIIKTYGN
ncbi:MAG TPA: hypothetical protein DDY82_02240 [Clostridiales bacterium]|nr:hypothetical protein [Clostridiales bacterium]